MVKKDIIQDILDEHRPYSSVQRRWYKSVTPEVAEKLAKIRQAKNEGKFDHMTANEVFRAAKKAIPEINVGVTSFLNWYSERY